MKPSMVTWGTTPARARAWARANLALAVRIAPLVLLAILLTAIALREPWRNAPPIRHDGAGYHAWTRAIVQREFSFCMWERISDLRSYVDLSRGMCQNKYPPGLALLHFPVMAPLLDLSPNAPLISPAEHRMCLVLGALTLWAIAALLTWIAVLLRVPPWRSTIVILSALFGTGLFHYATYDASFSHVHSALIALMLLALAIREAEQGRSMPVALLVLGGFFTIAIRATSALLLAELCLAYLYWNRARFRHAVLRGVLPAAVGGAVAIALQLAYNWYAVGHFTLSSYGEESFLFDRPMQLPIILSYERGLITYFPLFAVALALGFAIARSRGWASLLLVQTATLVVLYGYWHSWTLGSGFGHRGFVELGPLVAVVLLIAVRDLSTRAMLVPGAVAISCGIVTLQVMLGYWRGSYPMDEATSVEYWKHLRMLESALSGGTQCSPARCNALKWRCTHRPEPEFSPCSINFGEPGNCTRDGECAPIVALKSLAGDLERPYVTAPPSTATRARPLAARAAVIGPWEKFMVVPIPDKPHEVKLQSLVTNRFVKVVSTKSSATALVANAETPEEAESFILQDKRARAALQASTGKFVSVASGQGATPITVDADRSGPRERFAVEPTLP